MKIKNLITQILSCLLGLGLTGMAGTTFAQEGDESVENSSTEMEMTVIAGEGLEGSAPMIFSSESINGAPAKMRFMSGGDGAFFSSVGPSMGGAPDPFSLLSDPSVQKDLELVGDQLDQVRSLQNDFAAKLKEKLGDLSKGGINPGRFDGIGELVKQSREDQKVRMKELLLPHQIDRLKQVALQKHMNSAGTAGALTDSSVAEALGISDEQKDRLKEKAKEIKADLAKKMEQLKEDAKTQLLQELTPAQREQLKEMTGAKYKSDPKDFENDIKRRFQMRRPSRDGGQ